MRIGGGILNQNFKAMKRDQFNSLRIGDSVIRAGGSGIIPVTDIDRASGLIQTAGAWRYYKAVRLPSPSIHFTPIEDTPDYIMLPTTMVRNYGLVATGIIMAVRRAGPGGFIGSMENLCHNTHVCDSVGTVRRILLDLLRGHVLRRKDMNKHAFQLTEIAGSGNQAEQSSGSVLNN